MIDLNSLKIFAKVVEANSFSEAARRLKMPVSTVSRRISELEDSLDVRLLERSTRSLRPTDIGAEILEHAKRTADISDEVSCIVSNQLSDVSGLLRLSAPPSISDSLLAPLIVAFQAAYPNVRVQVLVTERYIDHITEDIDLVFRIGDLKDSALVARSLLTYRSQLVASPAYLERHMSPEVPQDLLNHKLLAFMHRLPIGTWEFTHVDGVKTEMVNFQPYFAMNDFIGLTAALITGAGIGVLPPVVQPYLIREGRLIEVMKDWRLRSVDLSIVHLGNRHISRVVRVFKEFSSQMVPTLFPDIAH